VLELLTFVLVGFIFHKSIDQLKGSFFAYLLLFAFMLPTTWWLREWERRGASTKKLVHGWAISVSLFMILIQVASYYSAINLKFITNLDWGAFFFAMVCGVSVVYITAIFYIPIKLGNRSGRKYQP
jgi:hypothetical protein